MRPRLLEIHIEELVLGGFDGVHARELRPAVERELTRLFAENSIPSPFACDRATASIDGGTFNVSTDADAEAVGAQISEAVHRGASR